jgi:hypothetical protein
MRGEEGEEVGAYYEEDFWRERADIRFRKWVKQ